MSIVSLGFTLTSYVLGGAYLALHLFCVACGYWKKIVSSTLALAIWPAHIYAHKRRDLEVRKSPVRVRDLGAIFTIIEQISSRCNYRVLGSVWVVFIQALIFFVYI